MPKDDSGGVAESDGDAPAGAVGAGGWLAGVAHALSRKAARRLWADGGAVQRALSNSREARKRPLA
jgi:hypothetical protein